MTGYPRLAADAGRIVSSPDVAVGDLELALFNVPEEFESANPPTLFLAASASGRGWRPQYVEISHLGRRQFVQTPRRKSILGRTTSALGTHGATGSVEVVLHDADQWLVSCSDADLELGDNFAAVGNEIIQFGDATSLGSGRFRLTRLLRGRWGTQGAIGSHLEGEHFVLIEPGALQPITLPVSKPGSPVRASALSGTAQCCLTLARREGRG
jgi:hypothetical protein